MMVDFKLILVCVFCVLTWSGHTSAKCKPSNKCKNKGGECLGIREEVPDGAEFLGKCKGKCKCYKNADSTVQITERSTVCTVGGPDPGQRCQFPFKVGTKVYNACKEVGGGKSICATATKKNGKHERKKWGYCGRCSEAVRMLPNLNRCHIEHNSNSTTRGAAGESFKKWSNNIVPYQFASSFTSTDRQTFVKATEQIAAASCVSFVESTSSEYLYVTRVCECGGSCFQGGYTDGLGAASPRTLTIESACLNPNSQANIGFLIHETLHALGIEHTQNRPDRKSYIKVNFENIPDDNSTRAQYELCSECNTYNTDYDCSSVMHYRVSPSTSKPSMTALNKNTCDLFSPNGILTDSDKELINKIYNCPVATPSPPTTSTCLGSCGGKAPTGCYCDSSCAQYNDCCPDKQAQCSPTKPKPAPTTSTCLGSCGGKAPTGCYCDSSCVKWNDCCEDKNKYC